MATSNNNETLLWPPPPFDETQQCYLDDQANLEAANMLDLFTYMHVPGNDNDAIVQAPGGIEIQPSKLVFDAVKFYPACTKVVQQRIVKDLQQCYSRTSAGRELAVKEWANENQNRGILRLRLRCKKAPCKLQFQVNWDTQQRHWFISRQCDNLYHTCPLPQPKVAKGKSKSTKTTRRKKATSSSVSTNQRTSSKAISAALPGTIPEDPPFITDSDRAEAELLADDLKEWIPPSVVSSSNTTSTEQQQELFPHPGALPNHHPPLGHAPSPMAPPPASVPQQLMTHSQLPVAPVPAFHDPNAIPEIGAPQQQPMSLPQPSYSGAVIPGPPVESFSLPTSQQHPPQQDHAVAFAPAPLTAPITGEQALLMHPPAPTNEQHSSFAQAHPPTQTVYSTHTGNHDQHQHHSSQHAYYSQNGHSEQPHQAPSSPNAYSSSNMELNSMSLGVGSVMSIEDNGNNHMLQHQPLSNFDLPENDDDGHHGDGLSVMSDVSDLHMLTIGSTSSKLWMANGLSGIPAPSALNKLAASDTYNSIGSWFDKATKRPCSPPPPGVPVTLVTSNDWTRISQTNNNTAHSSSLMINDQTMNSLTDSVRNALSLVGKTNETRESEGSGSNQLMPPPPSILQADFFQPPPTSS